MPSHNVVILQSTSRSAAQPPLNRSITPLCLLPAQAKNACDTDVRTDSNAVVVLIADTYIEQTHCRPFQSSRTFLSRQSPTSSLNNRNTRRGRRLVMSSRHSSHGGSPRGSHTSSSASYHSQQPNQQQQYLSPEDVYRMDREGNYFMETSLSYTQSRHGSSTSSTPYSDLPPHQRLPSQPFSPSSFDPYAYQAGGHASFLPPARRTTPPDDMGGCPRHSDSHGVSHRETSKENVYDRAERSQGGSPRAKGKGKEHGQTGEDRGAGSGNGRHDPSGKGNSRKASGPTSRLVSGVFIRY